MSDLENCRVCGQKRPADAPSGLCPACLLKAGLAANGPKLNDMTIVFGPASSSVLAAFVEEFGKIPPVLLRDADSASEPSPVIRPSSAEIPDPAQRSARLQLFGEIARGGMGAVLKGRDADLGRDLAVKILLESHRDKPEMVRRFIEEAQIAGQLQHPGIVPVYELGAFGDRRPYFAMKLVKGHTLAEILANRKSLSEGLPRLLSIFESICQTMAYAHARGVIHRDLKPSNVMVGSFGEVQVMDWGLAKVLPRGGTVEDASAGRTKDHATVIATARSGTDSELSQAGSIMGTPSYMAPEQARGEIDRVDERADVFALGSIFCELLTGQPAFTGRNSGEIQRKAARGELSDAFARLDQAHLGHDPDLIALARSCLSPERDDRPRNAGEVAARMGLYHSRVQERLRQSEIERAAEKARAEEATKRVAVERQRMRLTVSLAASLLGFAVLGGSGGFWIYQQRQSRLTHLESTLTRIQTLQEQARSDGAESPRRREALAVADEALASLGGLARSDGGLRLVAFRDELAAEQAQAERGQKLLAELESIRPRRSQLLEQWEPKADRQFSEAFQRYNFEFETTGSEEAIRALKQLPATIRRGLVSNLDRWIVIQHDYSPEPGPNAADRPLQRILEVIHGLDPDPERNRLRAFLLKSDLQPMLGSLQETASQDSVLDSGPEMPLLVSRLLTRAGDTKTALNVLRRSVLRYPGDLWTNLDLANQTDGAADALRYFTAARALEPQMGFCLSEMFECGMYKEEGAIAVRRELARIEPDNLNNVFLLRFSLNQTGRETEAQLLEKHVSEYLSEAALRHPDDLAVHGRRAFFSLFTYDINNAIASFREVSRLDPNDAECRYWLGLVLRQNKQLPDAIKELREAVRLSPLKPDCHDALSSALRQAKDRTGEIAELREAIRLEENQFREAAHGTRQSDETLNSSIISSIVGEFNMLIKGMMYGTLWRLKGGFQGWTPGRYDALCDALVEAGDINGGIAVFRDAIQAHPEEIHLRLRLAEMVERQGQSEESIAIYRDAIAAHPQSVELHKGLARLLEIQGKLAESNAAIDTIIDLLRNQLQSNPAAIDLHQTLAKMVERRGKIEESIAVYRDAIKAHPECVELHEGLAELLERQERTAEANTELDQAIVLLKDQLQAKEDVSICHKLGTVYLRRGDRQEAISQFQRLIELNPKPSDACNTIAWDLATAPDPKLRDGAIAVEFASKACELTDWKDSMYLDTLAAADAESGDFQAAVKWQTKAIELESNEENQKDYGQRLKLYQEKKPFHSSGQPD